MKSELQDHEAGTTLSLRFSADNIEFTLDNADNDSFKGWTVELFGDSCAVSNIYFVILCMLLIFLSVQIPFNQAVSLGYTKEVCIPPKYLVNVYGDNSVPDCEERLRYPVLLKGALVGNGSEEPTLFIKRTMRDKGLVICYNM